MKTEVITEPFQKFSHLVNERLVQLSGGELYTTDVEDMAAVYLAAFPEGANPMFRVKHEYDCSCCKQFIRRLGSLVAIENGELTSVWDVEGLAYPFDVVAKQMQSTLANATITGIFRTVETKFGVEYNYDSKTNQRFNHFWGHVPTRYRSQRAGSDIGEANSLVAVFKRGLEELKPEAIADVLDLISSKSLYRGEEFAKSIQQFQELQTQYQKASNKQLFVWSNYKHHSSSIRNTAIGTLLIALSAGEEMEASVAAFERMVAPINYKRPTALITPRMIESAVDTIRELGLENALERRYAVVEDVSVNNVLFVDNGVRQQMRDGLTDTLMQSVKPTKKKADNLAEVTIDEFMQVLLPKCSSIELMVEGKHLGNLVSLTAPVNRDVKPLLKWENNFAWSYIGDLTDSIKERVKLAGGNIQALLRCSLAWFNYDDLDFHCLTPSGRHIYFGNKQGILDVDMNAGSGKSRNAVENFAFQSLENGVYQLSVHNFNQRETIDVGFELEIEFGGQVWKFAHPAAVKGHDSVAAAKITVENKQVVKVEPAAGLTGGGFSVEKWGIKTETFVPVDTIMLSPNHWDGHAIGNKHWFFMLKNCVNPEGTRGIYNEFIRGDLEQHRKVFEVLGGRMRCPASDKQLSGLGFSSTKSETIVVRVSGSDINRQLKIKF